MNGSKLVNGHNHSREPAYWRYSRRPESRDQTVCQVGAMAAVWTVIRNALPLAFAERRSLATGLAIFGLPKILSVGGGRTDWPGKRKAGRNRKRWVSFPGKTGIAIEAEQLRWSYIGMDGWKRWFRGRRG